MTDLSPGAHIRAEYLKERYFGETKDFDDPDMYWVEVDPTFYYTMTGDTIGAIGLLQAVNGELQSLGINRERYFFTGDDNRLRVHFYTETDAVMFKLGNNV